jgi:hypothetical protein
MPKKKEHKKVTVTFDERHLPVIARALEVFMRMRSGQITMALAEAIMHSGGNPFTVMKKYEELLVVLSNNHITITAEHDHRFSNP